MNYKFFYDLFDNLKSNYNYATFAAFAPVAACVAPVEQKPDRSYAGGTLAQKGQKKRPFRFETT